jgi:hypothetical protein
MEKCNKLKKIRFIILIYFDLISFWNKNKKIKYKNIKFKLFLSD